VARIRTVKPDFFTSEDIVALTPMARLLYIASWCEADRDGRMVWRPRTMKMRYFPADDCDIDALARELHASRLVVPYGDGLAYIPSFARHQHVNPREAQSVLPAPETARVDDASARVSDAQGGRKGKEGKERNGDGADAPDPKKAFWDSAIALVGESNRARIGKLCKQHGEDAVAAAVAKTAMKQPANPCAYIAEILKAGEHDPFAGAF
jgi:hypothetical protein